jgi:hypothetical protein
MHFIYLYTVTQVNSAPPSKSPAAPTRIWPGSGFPVAQSFAVPWCPFMADSCTGSAWRSRTGVTGTNGRLRTRPISPQTSAMRRLPGITARACAGARSTRHPNCEAPSGVGTVGSAGRFVEAARSQEGVENRLLGSLDVALGDNHARNRRDIGSKSPGTLE